MKVFTEFEDPICFYSLINAHADFCKNSTMYRKKVLVKIRQGEQRGTRANIFVFLDKIVPKNA